MKFCKNLQKVVDISDPEWAPYWTNYKMLKKLIKELPSLVPADGDGKGAGQGAGARSGTPDSVDSSVSSKCGVAGRQQHGDRTGEARDSSHMPPPSAVDSNNRPGPTVSKNGPSLPSDASEHPEQQQEQDQNQEQQRSDRQVAIGKSPGEVTFFKLLHAEFKKATHFFDRAEQEFIIREERVREGMQIMKRPNSIMVSEKWSLLARSLYRLYKDLLLFETFAIMTYCSFSKILKKHDKVTGYNTRNAFMSNVVNKANFTSYPRVLAMIRRCEQMYEEVSEKLMSEGKDGLYEDERLFINMIHRLNEQVMDTAEGEGAERTSAASRRSHAMDPTSSIVATLHASRGSSVEANVASSLRLLVEENDKKAKAAQMSDTDDSTYPDRKRSIEESLSGIKRTRR